MQFWKQIYCQTTVILPPKVPKFDANLLPFAMICYERSFYEKVSKLCQLLPPISRIMRICAHFLIFNIFWRLFLLFNSILNTPFWRIFWFFVVKKPKMAIKSYKYKLNLPKSVKNQLYTWFRWELTVLAHLGNRNDFQAKSALLA